MDMCGWYVLVDQVGDQVVCYVVVVDEGDGISCYGCFFGKLGWVCMCVEQGGVDVYQGGVFGDGVGVVVVYVY